MKQVFKLPPRRGVGENEFAEAFTVGAAVWQQVGASEECGHRLGPFPAGTMKRTHDLVGIRDIRAQLGKQACEVAFSTGNSARQGNAEHEYGT